MRGLVPYYAFLCRSVLLDGTNLHVRHLYVQETISYCLYRCVRSVAALAHTASLCLSILNKTGSASIT